MVIIVILYLQDIDVNVMLTILILYPRISVSAEALMTIITDWMTEQRIRLYRLLTVIMMVFRII